MALVLETRKNFTIIDKDYGRTILNIYPNTANSHTIDLGNNSLTNAEIISGKSGYFETIVGNNGNLKISANVNAHYYQVNGEGYTMHGINTEHKYRCVWRNDRLHFIVDSTEVGDISDRRLKKDIKEIDESLLKAINEVEYKQFKKDNRGELISVGIIAQDLMEVFKKYDRKPEDYELFDQIQYRLDDETLYYVIDYTQFLLLKTISKEREIEELKQKDKQKDEIIANLITRIEKLEKLEKAGENK